MTDRDSGPDNDQPCETCGGEGTVSVDMFTPSRGHYTIEEPCEACQGDEYADVEPEDLEPLERWFTNPSE